MKELVASIQNDPILKTKLQMLQMAEEMGNVTLACERAGFSRDTFYRVRALFKGGGVAALTHKSKGRSNLKNRVPMDVEEAILTMSTEHPEYGKNVVSRKLGEAGIKISAAGVRLVWVRHGLETIEKRCIQAGKPLPVVRGLFG